MIITIAHLLAVAEESTLLSLVCSSTFLVRSCQPKNYQIFSEMQVQDRTFNQWQWLEPVQPVVADKMGSSLLVCAFRTEGEAPLLLPMYFGHFWCSWA